MKTIKFYVVITMLALASVSCVENSSKYKDAIAQLDSLTIQNQNLDSSYNQTLDLLNEIETGFAEIRQTEGQMKVNLNGVEGNPNRKERIGVQMMEIKTSMEQNKAKIAELQRLASKNGKANAKLAETIKRLQTEMDVKGTQIAALQAELVQKDIKINELNAVVTDKDNRIAEQNNAIDQQNSTIKGQDADLHTVWYCVATSKKLKEDRIITGGGLFQPKKIAATELDPKKFTQADFRSISSIPTNSQKVKLLSLHPQDSYKLLIGSDKKVSISITNPSKFWSLSRYLVVQI